jgi:hypothetical protein
LVSLSRIYKYKIIGRISLSRVYRYKIISRVSLSRIYKYKIRKLVTSSHIYKYKILSKVSLSRIYRYRILHKVSLSRVYRYKIRHLVSKLSTFRYKITGVQHVGDTDVTTILTDFLRTSWTDNPYSTVDHYLIPPKNRITFGTRFDMSAGSHSDCHIHVRHVEENADFINTDWTLQDNQDIVNIYVEVRWIPDAPLFNSTSPAPPSRMMWHIRSYIDELLRSNPQQLSNTGIDVISIIQEIPDSNTPADVHGQSAIEQIYTIIFTVKVFYMFKVDRVA